MALSRPAALTIDVLLLIFAVVAFYWGLDGIMSDAVYDSHYLLTIVLVVCGCCRWSEEPAPDRSSCSSGPAQALVTGELPGPATGAAPQRLDYLDNLKAFLAASVVVHHASAAFTGGNYTLTIGGFPSRFRDFSLAWREVFQSFFMVLFFFISGHFTPSSYEHKGARAFLVDKHRRLGIPLLVWTFAIHPLLISFGIFVLFDFHGSPYRASSDHMWFVLFLLLCNEAYLMISDDEKPLKLDLPSLPALIFGGLSLGIVTGVCCLVASGRTILLMPVGISSLPFYAVGFALGCCAKTNKWLEKLGKRSDYRLGVLGAISSLLAASQFILAFTAGGDIFTTLISGSWKGGGRLGQVAALGYVGFAGIECVVFSATCLVLFKEVFNFSNGTTKSLSGNAYGLYVVHPLILAPVLLASEKLISALQGRPLQFYPGPGVKGYDFIVPVRSYDYIDPVLLAVACICATVLTLLIAWPLAACLRRVPGLRRVF